MTTNVAAPAVRAVKPREACRLYSMGRTKLYALMKSGKLRTVKIGGTRLVPIEELEALLKRTS
jgi:excisionase family DNA binding protein